MKKKKMNQIFKKYQKIIQLQSSVNFKKCRKCLTWIKITVNVSISFICPSINHSFIIKSLIADKQYWISMPIAQIFGSETEF